MAAIEIRNRAENAPLAHYHNCATNNRLEFPISLAPEINTLRIAFPNPAAKVEKKKKNERVYVKVRARA